MKRPLIIPRLPLILCLGLVACLGPEDGEDEVGSRTAALIPPDVFDGAVVPTAGHAGWTGGGFDVSPDGAATYRVPIVVPTGRAGLAPSLSLKYDSSRGNGIMGVGWSVAGLSAITICPESPAARWGADFSGRKLCLDGRAIAGDHVEGDPYTRVEEFSNMRGGRYFRVYPRDGRILVFGDSDGTSADAEVRFITPEYATREYAWLLSRIEDRHDNAIEVRYGRRTWGEALVFRPDEIQYVSRPGSAGRRRVRFEYDDATRPDPITINVHGVPTAQPNLLERVVVEYLDAPGLPSESAQTIRIYELSYDVGEVTHRSRLTSVTECDGGGVCRSPIEMGYSSPSPLLEDVRDEDTGITAPRPFTTGNQLAPDGIEATRVTTQDLSRDGRDDLLIAQRRRPGFDAAVAWAVAENHRHAGWKEGPTDLPSNWAVSPADLDLDGFPEVITAYYGELGTAHTEVRRLTRLIDEPTAYDDAGSRLATLPACEGLWGSAALGSRFAIADMTGSGVPDLLFACSGSEWAVHRHRGVSYFDYGATVTFPGSETRDNYKLVDYDGDARAELLEPDGDGWCEGEFPGNVTRCWERSDIQPSGMPTSVITGSGGHVTVFIDANGDGLSDEVGFTDETNGIRIRMNHGGGDWGGWKNGLAAGSYLPWGWDGAGYKLLTLASIKPGDFNGDGRQDFVLLFHDEDPRCSGAGEGEVEPPPADVDAPPACIHPPIGREMVLYLSRGESFFATQFGAPFDPHWAFAWPPAGVADDIRGKGFYGWPTTTVGDTDGDGLNELIIPGDRENANFLIRRHIDETPDLLVTVQRSGGTTGFIEYGNLRGEDPTAGETATNDAYRMGAGCSYPHRCVNQRSPVVERFVDELHHGYRYFYEDARSDVRTGRWLGFQRMWVVGEDDLSVREVEYAPHEDDAGRPISRANPEIVREVFSVPAADFSQTHIEETVYEHSDHVVLDVDHRVLRRRRDRQFDVERWIHSCVSGGAAHPSYCLPAHLSGLSPYQESEEVYSYDQYGSLDHATTSVGMLIEKTVDVVYDPPREPHLYGLPATVTESHADHDDSPTNRSTRATGFEWSTRGGLLERSVDPGGANELRTVYALGEDGQVDSIALQDGTGTFERSTAFGYDGDRVHVERIDEGPSGASHTTWRAVHPFFDQVVYTRDLVGRETRTRLDGFGRHRETLVDGVSRGTTRYRGTGDDWMHIESLPAAAVGTATIIDRLGRTHAELTQAFGDEDTWITRRYSYDGWARPSTVYHPHFASDPEKESHTYHYDTRHRVTRISAPSRPDVVAEYFDNDVTMTDREGRQHTTWRDAAGRVIQRDDPMPGGGAGVLSTRFEYNYHRTGLTTRRFDAEGNAWVNSFDNFGRRVSSDDPDTGARGYVYTPLWELSEERNSSFRLIRRTTYDDWGRVATRETPEEGLSSFTYDLGPNALGRLSRAETTSSRISGLPATISAFDYDSSGRLRTETTQIDGEAYQIEHGYDLYDRAKTLGYLDGTHPQHLEVTYDYEPTTHHLTGVRNGGQQYWRARGYNELGLVDDEVRGATETRRKFDFDTGRLARTETRGVAAGGGFTGPQLHRQSFLYDDMGRLERRFDEVTVSVERFGYDELGRLTDWEFPNIGESRTYEYDQLGNLTGMDGVTHTYGSISGARFGHWGPHQLRNVGGTGRGTVSWDDRGRITKMPGLKVRDYTSFDLPLRLKTESGTTVFGYDAFGSRVYKEGPAGTTTYVGGLYERREPTGGDPLNVFHIFAGGVEVAQVARDDDGAEEVTYVHQGALGSVELITDASGDAVGGSLRFDPMGRRVEPGTPLLADVSSAPADRYPGFTGHEHDSELGLINMRGRMFSPTIGRFLTADPLMHDAQGSEGVNPYSYGLNSPMNYVDPTGLDPCDGPCFQAVLDPVGAFFVGAISDEISSASSGGGGGASSDSRPRVSTVAEPPPPPRPVPEQVRPRPSSVGTTSQAPATYSAVAQGVLGGLAAAGVDWDSLPLTALSPSLVFLQQMETLVMGLGVLAVNYAFGVLFDIETLFFDDDAATFDRVVAGVGLAATVLSAGVVRIGVIRAAASASRASRGLRGSRGGGVPLGTDIVAHGSERAARRAALREAGIPAGTPASRAVTPHRGSRPRDADGTRAEWESVSDANVEVHHDPYGHRYPDEATIPPHYGVEVPGRPTRHHMYPTTHDPSTNR
ncbi:MAG: hypothetical protein DRJ42_09585 [Deltaproteobacteria bacterium]|nr:MAG: hypothetical protein DRJ42_09585 [Deltaproteobacteria bacterium]